MSRPEHQGPPEYYYNETEASKYTDNSRIIHIQTEMAERAMELLCLPSDDPSTKLVLDLGCGSALAGSVIKSYGHAWIGMDISSAMLDIANKRVDEDDEEESQMEDIDESGSDEEEEEEEEDVKVPLKDLLLHDMGEGVCFRAGTFDGCISISALQWLCHSNKSCENPKGRLSRLFATLFASLARGARAVFQFYPENAEQIDLILGCATKAGFSGGLVVDYPNSTKSKKYYLVLMTGTTAALPRAKTGEEGASDDDEVAVGSRVKAAWRDKLKARKMKDKIKGKDWVVQKKDLYRKRGREVPEDSKFTARKRRPRF